MPVASLEEKPSGIFKLASLAKALNGNIVAANAKSLEQIFVFKTVRFKVVKLRFPMCCICKGS